MRAPSKRYERLKMRLRLAGSSFAQIGRDLDVHPTTVTGVCRGTSRSRRIELHVARILGTSPEKLWPERYPRSDERPLPSPEPDHEVPIA